MPSQVFFITGTSSGFGRELVKKCLQEGDKVIATSRNASKLSFPDSNPSNLLTLDCDCTDPASVAAAFTTALTHFPRIDVVVNNAGYGLAGELETLTPAQIRRQMDVNFFGVLHVTRHALSVLRAQSPPGGRILQITSVAARIGIPGFSTYCASKWAVEGLTEALAKELRPEWGVFLTNVEPGGFRTEWAGGSMEFAERHPAYEHMDVKALMSRRHGTQAGDPVKGARAFWDVAKMEKPPLRIALGSDCFAIVKKTAEDHLEMLERDKQFSLSTDVDGYQKP